MCMRKLGNLCLLFCVGAFLTLTTLACSSSKKTQTAQKPSDRSESPSWVQQRPTNSAYYVGVGVSSKRGTGPEYAQIAKRNALSDLTAEIKVSVSSNSVFSQFENDNRFRQDFQDVVRLKAKEDIQDFEVVDSWENQEEFWIYYRLSKSRYAELKAAKIQKALNAAKAYVMKAQVQEKEAQIQSALNNYFQAFYEVESLLDEDLRTEVDGKEVYFGNFLVSEMRRLLQNVQLMPVAEVQTSILWGSVKAENQARFVLLYKDKAVSGMKVQFKSDGVPLESSQATSDQYGQLSAAFKSIPANKSQFELKATLITPESDSRLLNRILNGNNASSNLTYKVRKPKIFVTSEEKNLNQSMSESILANNAKALIAEEGFTVTADDSEADYRLFIQANTSEGGSANGFFTCYLNGRIVMERRDGTEQFSYALTQIKGLKLDFNAAGLQAYKETVEHLKKKAVPAMVGSF